LREVFKTACVNGAFEIERVFCLGMFSIYCFVIVLRCGLRGVIGEGCFALLFDEGRLHSVVQ
jgi:hypothetical protein